MTAPAFCLRFDCVFRMRCNGLDCIEQIELMVDAAFALDDTRELVSRAAAGYGWLFVSGKAYCPRCSHRLSISLRDGDRDAWSKAIRTALIDHHHLQAIDVVRGAR